MPNVPKKYHESLETLTKYLIDTNLESHQTNKTDPDDVAIGAIQIISRANTCYYNENERGGYPHIETVLDRTTEFFPDFKITVDSPWGTYSYPNHN